MNRRFLFLQGVCSPFFSRLGAALRAQRHQVSKVNFTVGDRVYWSQGDSTNYRGEMDALPDFYKERYEALNVTDIVLFGDCRPVHRPAINLAKQCGVRIHVFEEGYFRPHWVTLEQNGVNGNSSLSADPEWYREQAGTVPHYNNGEPFNSAFWKRAAYDVGYNFWAGLNPLMHRGVRSHIPYSPLTEYIGYLHRGLRVKYYEKQSRECEARLIAQSSKNPFFLLPLQLASDAQIVHHSPFPDMLEAMTHTMRSFAVNADSNSRLAIKIHPLDPGLINYHKAMRRSSFELGLADRVVFLESGNLPALLEKTAGVVTVNSTVGPSAIIHGRPTIALGHAIYDMPGLTYQGGIDSFWSSNAKPDMALFRAFRDVVIQRTQINGGFYCNRGISLALGAAAKRLTET
ncbi:capsular biosynthesis protein [Alcaligenaceae bacterium C4P045]|nr:capsular biosynthesis protein [Alcaligenaceae bacterium C4P045]